MCGAHVGMLRQFSDVTVNRTVVGIRHGNVDEIGRGVRPVFLAVYRRDDLVVDSSPKPTRFLVENGSWIHISTYMTV